MKKRIAALLFGTMLALTLSACGSDEEATTTEEPAAEETASEDAAEDGAEEIIEVPVSVVNGTGVEIAELYVSGGSVDEWGEDLLGSETMPSGTYLDLVFTVDANNLEWDIMIVDTEGTSVEFMGIDISEMPADGFAIELTIQGENVVATPIADVSELEGDYSMA